MVTGVLSLWHVTAAGQNEHNENHYVHTLLLRRLKWLGFFFVFVFSTENLFKYITTHLGVAQKNIYN